MLAQPPVLIPAVFGSVALCLLIGGLCSVRSVWAIIIRGTPGDPPPEIYLKAGEYGESEIKRQWSPFIEPFNAWTSLAYSFFGFIVIIIGFSDLRAKTNLEELPNTLALNPGFSILLGIFLIYLGISSCLFHASHLEKWRKADAGMTSGVVLPLVLFSIWDRLRPPGIIVPVMLWMTTFLLVSLIRGYVPYGSSDIVLPCLVAFVWSVELLPRFGGVVDDMQYMFWLQCFVSVIGGVILRAVDIKRKTLKAKNGLLAAFFIVLLVFWMVLPITDYVVISLFCAGVFVANYPSWGHVCWHLTSSFSVFIWWYMLRLRPGDPFTPYGEDSWIVCWILLVAVKNALRRIVMNIPTTVLPFEYRDAMRLTFEHCAFSLWGYYAILVVPTPYHSWFTHPVLCWYSPAMPYEPFQLYYTAKVAAVTEDVLYLWLTGSTVSKPDTSINTSTLRTGGGSSPSFTAAIGDEKNDDSNNKEGKTFSASLSSPPVSSSGYTRSEVVQAEHVKQFHHNLSALMAITSFLANYAKIGSLVMYMHDVSDVPLDVFRLLNIKGSSWRRTQLLALAVTIPVWSYWRLWLFPTTVLHTIVFESKSMVDKSDCEPGHCTWLQVPERAPFLMCLTLVLLLNLYWLIQMVRKGYKMWYP